MIMNNSNILPRRDANAADFKTLNTKFYLSNKVTKYTRAGKNGKQIVCPECRSIRTVYHFNFSGLTCPECKESVDKYEWEVYNSNTNKGEKNV